MHIRHFVSVLLAFFIVSCDGFISEGEITVYPVACEVELKNGVCEGVLLPLNKTVYKVSSSSQTVIHWMPGIWEEPQRLANCVVRNRKNWVAEYKDGSGKMRMVKGKFYEEPTDPNEFHVSKWRWWYADMTGGKDLRAKFRMIH